jgi:hypothetical protein
LQTAIFFYELLKGARHRGGPFDRQQKGILIDDIASGAKE